MKLSFNHRHALRLLALELQNTVCIQKGTLAHCKREGTPEYFDYSNHRKLVLQANALTKILNPSDRSKIIREALKEKCARLQTTKEAA